MRSFQAPLRLALFTLLCLFTLRGHAQQVNPGTGIRWQAAAGCTAAGNAYFPGTNTCFNPTLAGVVDVTNQTGADLGAKINFAVSAGGACPPTQQCLLYVPAGNYTFSTPIVLPLNFFSKFSLVLNPGATLIYGGTGDMITFNLAGAGATDGNCRVQGGSVFSTNPAATSAIHILPTNTCQITDMIISGFAGGAGVWLDGTNSVNVTHNILVSNAVGVYMTNTYCTGTTCGPDPSFGGSESANANHVDHNTITGNGIGVQLFDVNTAANTGPLNDEICNNNMELNTIAISVGRSTSLLVCNNYFEGSTSIATQFGIPGGSDGSTRFFASKGLIIRDNYFTISAGQTQINLLDSSDTIIEGNGTVVAGQNSSNCFVNTLTNNGTNIGETGTYYSKNHVLITGGGNLLCIGGAPLGAFVGAGSFSLFNLNLALQLLAPNFTVVSSGTSETVTVPGTTLGSSCAVLPSANVPGGAATALASTLTITAAATGTFTHPSGAAGVHVAFACNLANNQ